MTHPLPVLAVAAAMVFLASMSLRAWMRSRNRILPFITAAFVVFAAKSLVTAYGLHTGTPAHEDLELVGTLLDLVIAALLVAPFLLRTRSHAA